MAFVKLDCGMLDSTIWFDREGREIFITALLMAEPVEILEPTPSIEIRSLNPGGFSVPPGWYGFVPAAGSGIIRRAGIDIESGMAALERLASPENESRTPDFEGRRMVRVDHGFIILNFDRYRKKDHTAAIRQKRWRDRQKNDSVKPDLKSNAVTTHNNTVTTRNVTQAEAEAEAEVQKKNIGRTASVVPPERKTPEFPAEVKFWNENCGSLPKVANMSKKRLSQLRARRGDLFWSKNFEPAVLKLKAIPFCQGGGPQGWRASFDWLLQTDSVAKIIEGKYDHETNRSTPGGANHGQHNSGRPTPAQQRNAQITGSDLVRQGILEDRKNRKPAPWDADYVPPVPSQTIPNG